MTRKELYSMRVYEWESDINDMDVNECFLMGESMKEQKNKSDLDYVSYYKVISKSNNRIQYVVKIEKMED